MTKVRVELGSRSYEVATGAGLLRRLSSFVGPLGEFEKVALIADATVDSLYGDVVREELERVGKVEVFQVEPGEKAKSWARAGELLDGLAAAGLRRHDLVVTLGGGVVSDLGGFVASAYLRGVRVVHVPTTLLGQVDAAVGGKTGVNLSAGKNLAGAFYQPSAVVCDVEALLSLPERELRSGLAEVVKYGLCFEPEVLNNFDTPAGRQFENLSVLEDLVARCAAIKASVVSEDETDRGGRLFLNYGHTFGHALEAAGGYEKFSHGEAVSVGMMFAAALSQEVELLDPEGVRLHKRCLRAAGLPVEAAFDPGRLTRFWAMDKKADTSQRWVLLEAIGRPVIRSDVGQAAVDKALDAVTA